MSKPKESTLHRIVDAKQWELNREKERITYPVNHAGPIQMDWRNRESYSATELNYRGRSKTL